MDLFRDGVHVQLRSRRGCRTFLCADDDWLGVSVRALRRVAFHSTVWRVCHHTRNGDTFLLLQGAYGRYLASSPHPPQSRHRGRAAVQRYFDGSNVFEALLWRPLRAQDGRYTILAQFGAYLRASCGDEVTVATCFSDEDRLMSRWAVVAVEAALAPALPPRTLSPDPDTAAVLMNLFPDGAFVQLELVRGYGKYLCASPDSLEVSLRPLGRAPFEATVWRVHLWHREEGVTFLMLQGAAYGRYLGGVSVSQGIWQASQLSYDGEAAHELMWEPMSLPRGIDFLLWNVRYGRLRASGRAMIGTHWKVHIIPASPTPPALPPPEPSNIGGFGDSFTLLQRKIRFVCADSEGCYPNTWSEFTFHGCSVMDLRAQVAEILNNSFRIILCVHSGCFGRLIPLVNNLPHNTEPMDVVVLHASSPAAASLRYPVEAPPTP